MTVRLLILAIGVFLFPIHTLAQGNQLAMNISSRVTPAERTDFEYELLMMMRGDSPVVQRGVGALAETLADLSSRGRMRRNEALNIAHHVAWLNSPPATGQTERFIQVKSGIAKIVSDGLLKRTEQREVIRCVNALLK